MRLDVALVPGEAARWRDTVCIVVDVLRASSTIVTLLDGGCPAVIPADGVSEARQIARSSGYVLAGERNGVPPSDFDFGNSPTRLSRASQTGKPVVLATSNGTRVLRRLRAAPAVLIGCLLNATACCHQGLTMAAEYGGRLGLVCAGRDGFFVLDDAACVGYLVETALSLCRAQDETCTLGDAAVAARQIYRSYPNLEAAFRVSASGRRVVEIGDEEDLSFCLRPDVTTVVPVLVPGSPARIECMP